MIVGNPVNAIIRLLIDPSSISDTGQDITPIFLWDIFGEGEISVMPDLKKEIIITWFLTITLKGSKKPAVIFNHETRLDLVSVTNTKDDHAVAEYIVQNSYVDTEKSFRSIFKDFIFDRPTEYIRVLAIQLMECLVDSGEY